MAKQSTKEREQVYITPQGVGKYLYLREPDTRFDAEGKFKATLELDPKNADAKRFADSINALMRKMKKANSPVHEQKDRDGRLTGKLEVRFATQFKPQVFDAKKNLVPEEVRPGSGSLVRIAYTINSYDGFGGGINLYLRGVQILEYKEYSGPSADQLGFQEEEGWSPDTSFSPDEFEPPETEKEGGNDTEEDLPL